MGLFAEPSSLLAALKALVAIGIDLPNICLAGMAASIHGLTEHLNGSDPGPLRALLRGMIETRLPGDDLPILASSSCVAEADPVLSLEKQGKVRAQIVNGAIMLAVSARNIADLIEVGRVLLRHSSHHVHTFECSLALAERA